MWITEYTIELLNELGEGLNYIISIPSQQFPLIKPVFTLTLLSILFGWAYSRKSKIMFLNWFILSVIFYLAMKQIGVI